MQRIMRHIIVSGFLISIILLFFFISAPINIAASLTSTTSSQENQPAIPGWVVAGAVVVGICYLVHGVRCYFGGGGGGGPVCGNGACESGENYFSCPGDCPCYGYV